MEFRLENEIPMSAPELWQTVQTPEFDAFMAKEFELYPHMRFERESSEYLIRRRLSISLPNVDMPGIARKAANKVLGGGEIVYEEIQQTHLDSFEMRWRLRPAVLTEKFHASGILRLTPIDGIRCLRIMEGRIHIRLFGLGGQLERLAAKQAKRTSDEFCQVVAKWKSENAKCGRSSNLCIQ
ncbi:MAG: DUF2505 family protein [Desulfobacterales bacterium]|nr:DUF2505 family protein [Desulfobacterales bacterium]